jgi:sodium-dependent dicarboxylate transporter 2/3/5
MNLTDTAIDVRSDAKPKAEPVASRRWRPLAGLIFSVLVPLAVGLMPLPLDPVARRALAVGAFMIAAWITESLPYSLTGFIGCYLFWALGIAKFNVAFGGFATETPWFCFGALLFGMMATKSGLATRVAYLVLHAVGASYSRILLGFVLVSFLLTLIVPSGSASVVIKATIALGILSAMGASKGSNMGRGVFVILTYTASMFNKLVIAGSSAILAQGLIQKFAGVEVLWSRWCLAFLPCTVVTLFVTWGLGLWLFPSDQNAASGAEFVRDELQKMGPWSRLEKRAALLMGAATALWMTDFVHHISPAMIGLGAGLASALPGIGVLDPEDMKKVNVLPVFFVATALSLGQVLMDTGAIGLLTTVMFAWMDQLISGTSSLALVSYWTAFFYHFFLGSELSMLSTSLPALMNFAAVRGFDPMALGMIWTFAGASKIFVYQSSVMILGYSYGFFDGRDLLRFGACMAIIESIVILLLVSWYWPLIGLV